MAYKLEYEEVPEADDQVYESHHIKIIVDPKSMAYIDGPQLDYVREGLNEGLKFTNPNEKASCGCGESYTVYSHHLG